MFWLILGVLIWSGVHLFPALMPAKRKEIYAKYGSKYEGVYSAILFVSLAIIVLGWRAAEPTQIYNSPVWGRHVTMLFVLIAIILFASAHMPSRIRQFVRHPMLTGMAFWAVGHLLANGDSRSVVLFGGMLIWSVVNQMAINRRDGAWVNKPAVGPISKEVILVVASVVVYGVLMFLHPYFTGVPVITHN